MIIDAQNTYRRGVMALEGIEPALVQCAKLLKRARAAGRPVLHIQHDGGAGSLYDISTDIGAIAETVAPISGETVIHKQYPNSFVDTDLQQRLQDLGVKQLVVVGFMSHVCVNSTTRGAFNLGYQVTIAADCTATRALAAPDGKPLAAEMVQAVALAALADLFAVVVPRQSDIPD
ncbi:isochorismatase [Ventosimonas gracilis]|uniref:Isochorismatase n=1 Tax=Ventosimonas gracilis TaxID=1680762 RepID=A0A139ST98_9GAMM|nr:isochorismatase [Ventosimonas gracilis]